MKRILKRIPILLCVLLMLPVLAGCGKKAEVVEYDEASVKSSAKNIITMIDQADWDNYGILKKQMDVETLEMSLKYSGIDVDGQAFLDATESLLEAKKDLGDKLNIDAITDKSFKINADAEEVRVLVQVEGSKPGPDGKNRTAEMELIYNSRLKLISGVTNINRSFSENMANAGMNTLLGMGTVFVVLIVIALIIYCFRFISIIEKRMNEKKNAPREKAEAIDNAVAHIIENEERSDDGELIAVISAAIAAYEAARGGSVTPTGDGYVVRSIKRIR